LHEASWQEFNAQIRTSGKPDGVIDLDAAAQDPVVHTINLSLFLG
jgi:hypothetical protein